MNRPPQQNSFPPATPALRETELDHTVDHREAEIAAIAGWQIAMLLRKAAQTNPRLARLTLVFLKLLWRTVTFQLMRRIPARHRNREELELISSSGLFDRDWYREQNLDVRRSGMDPLLHYLRHGASEGRKPSSIFDGSWYLSRYPDVAASGLNPLLHYWRHGVREGRLPRPPNTVGEDTVPTAAPGPYRGINSYLSSPNDMPFDDDGYFLNRIMFYIWRVRDDVKRVFDLNDKASRLEYCKWYLTEASREYRLSAEAYPDEVLEKLIACGGEIADQARLARDEKKKRANKEISTPHSGSHASADGANLVGYSRGEFGLGEHCRMTARAFSASGVPFSVIDHPEMGLHGSGDNSIEQWISDAQHHKINVICINADVLPTLYFALGESFFSDHYNIGYWAWELPKCPPEFDIPLRMVDEVWANSEFAMTSLRSRSPVPVLHMPLAVSLPVLRNQYSKAYFGLSEDSFQFLFTFDAASHLARKNPIGVVRAFKLAFPGGDEKVRLLLKTMNVPAEDPFWMALLAEAQTDRRIVVMDKRLSRSDVVGLSSVCDAFVSLHRSEGFGFGMAEAMLLGKPVIATNYSGSRDFAREGTACVVDYELVPVPERSYWFSRGQIWAEPNTEHAAALMRRLFDDDPYREMMARAGQRYVIDHFNEKTIGARYAARLNALKRDNFRTAQQRDLEAAGAEAARRRTAIEAARSDRQPVPVAFPAGISRPIREREEGVLLADLAQLSANLDSLKAQAAQTRATIERLTESIAAREKVIALTRERVDMRELVDKRGAGSRSQIIDAAERHQSELTTQVGEQGQLRESTAALETTEKKMAEAVAQFIADQSQKLAEAERKRDRLVQDLIKAKSKNERTRLRAPVAGVVEQLAVTTIGQVVSSGQSLMTIVPPDAPLEIEAMILNKDIGFVREGQEAVIKVEAFPFTRYGTIDGKVIKISPDAVDLRNAPNLSEAAAAVRPQSGAPSAPSSGQGGPELAFPATIAPSRHSLAIEGKDVKLSPGMSVTVEIKTGTRRILSYFLSPLREMVSQAAHER